jgi:hypothetical protein
MCWAGQHSGENFVSVSSISCIADANRAVILVFWLRSDQQHSPGKQSLFGETFAPCAS